MLASCYLAHRHNSLRFVFLISKNETVKIIMGGTRRQAIYISVSRLSNPQKINSETREGEGDGVICALPLPTQHSTS